MYDFAEENAMMSERELRLKRELDRENMMFFYAGAFCALLFIAGFLATQMYFG